MQIYSDNAIEYNWFKNLNIAFDNLEYHLINGRGKNPHIVEEVIKYDRPDIILCDEKKVYLVIEKTREVPTGHNVGQRMARLIRSVELNIPTIFICPFKARKHGKYTSICNINGRLFECFHKIWSIHNVPIHLLNWKCDENGELIGDGSEDKDIKRLLQMYIQTEYKGDNESLENEKEKLLKEFDISTKNFPNYKSPPNSVSFSKTKKLYNDFNINLKNTERNIFFEKEESVIYKIVMKQGPTAKRQDPYTGTQFIYDYLYCRNAKYPINKYRNLLLYFPLISKSFWLRTNPNIKTKSSNWYLTANGIIFKDGFLFIR